MLQNSLSRRSFLRGVAMGAGVVALAACAPAAPAPGGAAASSAGAAAASLITLAWWDYMGAADVSSNGKAVESQLAKYNASQSKVKVERTDIPFADLKQKLLQGAAAGELPDTVIIDNPDHSSFAALGVLADVTDTGHHVGQERRLLPRPVGLDRLPGQELRRPRQQQLPRPVVQQGFHRSRRPRRPQDLG